MGLQLQKSEGHLTFAFLGTPNACEYYQANDKVFRAPIHNAMNLEGRRHGRYERPLTAWAGFLNLLPEIEGR